MDILDFKAWDKETKELVGSMVLDVAEADPRNSVKVIMFLFPNRDVSLAEAKINPERYEVLQYTGLNDKNGTAIYEGYIVKYDDGDGWEVGRDVVKFIHGAFNCCCFHHENQEFVDEDRTIEVIGNIYENPELLETTNAKT
jgi:uncharacterized phage protein (TIGR01671 family)